MRDCDVGKFGALDNSEKTIVIVGERRSPQTKSNSVREAKRFRVVYGRNIMSGQRLEVSRSGAGTVLSSQQVCVVNGPNG